jgi:hypothetical protein
MKDTTFTKLKTDAVIVLADLWRALLHRPDEEFCRDPRVGATLDYGTPAKRPEPDRNLCYFHLN